MSAHLTLVTGANGFLGSEIVQQFIASGECVRATGRQMESVCSDVEYMPADVLVPETLPAVLKNVTTVIHAAGRAHIFGPISPSAETFHEVNEVGTANVASLAVAQGVQHFILISTVSVYGPFGAKRCSESGHCNPCSSYAKSKYWAERRCQEISSKSSMALTILRLTTLYGEKDPGNVNRLMKAIDKRRFVWVGNGSNRKSLLHKCDAARACQIVAAFQPSGTRIFNIPAFAYTMNEIVTELSRALGRKPLPVKIPSRLAEAMAGFMAKLPNESLRNMSATTQKWLNEDLYDSRRFEQTYGFEPQIGLRQGLERQVGWYRGSRQ